MTSHGFKLTVAQSPMATRNAGWVPKIYVLLAHFATMTSLKGSLFFIRFSRLHKYKSHTVSYPKFTAKFYVTTYIRQLLSCFVVVNTAWKIESQLSKSRRLIDRPA